MKKTKKLALKCQRCRFRSECGQKECQYMEILVCEKFEGDNKVVETVRVPLDGYSYADERIPEEDRDFPTNPGSTTSRKNLHFHFRAMKYQTN